MSRFRSVPACHWVWIAILLVPCSAVANEKPVDSLTVASDQEFDVTVKPFLNQFCGKCHGATEQKGDRRFDLLDGEIPDDNALVDLQDILDLLNLAEMPPQEELQPSDEQKQQVIAWLTQRLDQYHASRTSSGGNTVLRRLNAREYRNTIRDLVNLDMTMFDPAQSFPKDQTLEHLDNVGGTLVTSGYLLARYLAAAETIVNKAMTPLAKPEVQTWHFQDSFDQQPEIDQVHRRTTRYQHLTLYDVIGADNHEGAYGPIHAFKKGVPLDGYYEIRVHAEAVNRLHPYDPEFLGTDPNEPLRLGIVAGDYLAGPLHKPQPVEPQLADIALADEPQWYTVRVWLDAGFTPRFTFINGLMDARNLWAKLLRKYEDQFPKRRNGGIVEARYNAIKYGKLPQIHIHEVEIKGPLYDEWPTASQRAVLGDDWESARKTSKLSKEMMLEHLTSFASRAYRRPVAPEEIERVMDVIQNRMDEGRSPLDAYGDGLKTILCSPNFLYLAEPGDGPLSSYALASRLSYFLWASMPDQKLFDLARQDKLRDPKVLREQVDRMLDDPKSDGFVQGYLDSWLTLRDLGSSPPDRAQFKSYYHYDLGAAMRRETTLFTRHLIDQNLSLVNFLSSDFTFVNRPLAKLYGIDPPKGSDFELVKLTDRRRGGLLGQASVLTVSANGIDTSPVVRGVWLLENIWGTPPSPPPPDVEPLDPDVRGATTIREQLDKHRNVASCNECHRKIDPMGFALENFDPIGKWRDSYGRQTQVDPSGELPNGKSFKDVKELKEILVDQKDLFATALTRKMMAYAVGRQIEPADRPHVDDIVSSLRAEGYGMRDLIELVVLSEPFLNK